MDHCRRRRFAALHSDAAGGGDRATAAAAGSLAATPALALGSDVSGHAGNHSIYLRTGADADLCNSEAAQWRSVGGHIVASQLLWNRPAGIKRTGSPRLIIGLYQLLTNLPR